MLLPTHGKDGRLFFKLVLIISLLMLFPETSNLTFIIIYYCVYSAVEGYDNYTFSPHSGPITVIKDCSEFLQPERFW